MRGADGGVLRGAHLEGGGDDEAEIEGEIEELHVPRLKPPRVQPHLLRGRGRVGAGVGVGVVVGVGHIDPRRVGAHLDEELEVALDDVVELIGKVVAEGLMVGGVVAPRDGGVGDTAHHEGFAVEHDHLVRVRVRVKVVRVRVRTVVGIRVRIRGLGSGLGSGLDRA